MSKKMTIEHCLKSCRDQQEEMMMYTQFGKYMLVGWADTNSRYRVPVWRKVEST